MGEQGENSGSFISKLFKKLAFTKEVQQMTGKSTNAAQREAERQIGQAAGGGAPAKGEGVTKSGGDE